ncbi:hypothetical protein BH09VER1_BH09VER1_47100 [soil metagenome]
MKKFFFSNRWIKTSLALLAFTASTKATTYYWDGTNTVANNIVDGGTGAWNTANTNWTNVGGSINNAWVAGSDAIFSGVAGTVTLSAQTVGNITFSTSGYTVTASTLTLSNGSAIDTGSGTATINSNLGVGPTSYSKSGSGMLILGGNNTVTGTFNLNDGTVVANHAGNGKVTSATTVNIGDGAGSAGSAILQFGQNNTAPFVGSSSINLNSDGKIDLNGKTIGGINNVSSLIFNFSLGSTLVGNGNSTTGGGSLSISSNNGTGSATLTLSGSGAYSAAGGDINVSSPGSSLSGVGVGGAATLAVNNGLSIDTQGGNITLATGNAGGTTVSGNTNLSSSGGGSIDTGAGALIFATGTNNLGTATSSITRSGGAGESKALTIAGHIFLGAPSGGASQSNRQVTLASTGISSPTADNLVISATISDGTGDSGNGLIKTGAMSAALTAANTYTGTTTINQGALYAVDGVGLPTNSNLTLGGGVFESNGGFTRSLGTGSNQLIWTNGGFSARGGALTVAVGGTAAPTALVVGSNFLTNQMSFGSSLSDNQTLLQNNVNFNGVTTSVTVTDNSSTTSDYTEFSGTLSGSGQLLKTGDGLLYLSNNANAAATATTRLNQGVLRVTADAGSLLGGNLAFTNPGTLAVLESSGTFSRTVVNNGPVGWNAGANGGFSAYGGDLAVRLSNGTATVTIGSTVGFVTNSGTLAFGSVYSNGTVDFQNGLGLGNSGTTANIYVERGVSVSAPEVVFSNTLSGGANLQKWGAGKMGLTNTNTYTGTTTVSAGTLLVSGMGSINSTSSISINGSGAKLQYDSSVGLSKAVTIGASGGTFTYNSSSKYTGGALSLGTGAVLSGTGSVGSVTVGSGGVLSPGNSPGMLTADTTTWAGGGTYLWEINNATGSAGTNWDLLNVTAGNNLAITATSLSKFTLSINGLTAGNLAGIVPNFDNTQSYTWTIATVGAGGSITGFDPTAFTLDTSNFLNNNPAGGTFSLAVAGNNLNLVYAVPEPSTVALLGVAITLCLYRRRRVNRA